MVADRARRAWQRVSTWARGWHAVFGDGPLPSLEYRDGFLATQERLTEAQVKRIKAAWAAAYRGPYPQGLTAHDEPYVYVRPRARIVGPLGEEMR